MSLTEIAKLAGVSSSTVSRALSGRAGVATATRKRIKAIADRTGLEPLASGRALVTGRRETIGFVGDAGHLSTGEWTLQMLGGLAKGLEEDGYHTMVFYAEPSADRIPPMVLRRAVDGIVVVVSWTQRFLGELRERDMPVVVVDPGLEVECDTVRPDDAEGARMITRHLLQLGHQRIAYVGTREPKVAHVNQLRWGGFVEAMSATRLPVNPGGNRLAEMKDALDLALAADPTALVCFSDHLATWVMGELGRRGIRVPQDMSVTGFDDLAYLLVMSPNLTTVRVPYEEMGLEAARLILNRLEHPDMGFQHSIVGEQVVPRETSAPPRK